MFRYSSEEQTKKGYQSEIKMTKGDRCNALMQLREFGAHCKDAQDPRKPWAQRVVCTQRESPKPYAHNTPHCMHTSTCNLPVLQLKNSDTAGNPSTVGWISTERVPCSAAGQVNSNQRQPTNTYLLSPALWGLNHYRTQVDHMLGCFLLCWKHPSGGRLACLVLM